MKSFCFSLFLFSLLSLSAQQFQWAVHAGSGAGDRDERVLESFTDTQNNSYFLIYYASAIAPMLNGAPISVRPLWANGGYGCAVLVSYDCNGTFRWFRSFWSGIYYPILQYYDQREITTAHMALVDNHIIVAVLGDTKRLYVRNEQEEDTLIISHTAGNNARAEALVSFNTEGDIEWVTSLTKHLYPVTDYADSYYASPEYISSDGDHNIYLLTWIDSSSYTVTPAFPMVDNINTYLLKFSVSGSFLGMIPLGLPAFPYSSIYMNFIWLDHHFYTFAYRTNYAPFTVGGVELPLPAEEWNVAYLLKFDEQGNFKKYRRFGMQTGMSKMRTDGEHIYLVGGGVTEFNGDTLINPYPPYPVFSGIGFLAKIDTAGNTLYLGGHSYPAAFETFSFLPDSKLAMGGDAIGWTTFIGSFDFSDTNAANPVFAVFDENKKAFTHAVPVPASDGLAGDNTIVSVTADQEGNLLLSGIYGAASITVGDSVFGNYGDRDVFIARYGWDCGEEADWTGLSDAPAPEIDWTVFPNPASHWLEITGNGDTGMENVTFFNLLGQAVKQIAVHDTRAVINISDLHSGLYLLKITAKNGRQTVKKIIKE
jgi:hypothetical protein